MYIHTYVLIYRQDRAVVQRRRVGAARSRGQDMFLIISLYICICIYIYIYVYSLCLSLSLYIYIYTHNISLSLYIYIYTYIYYIHMYTYTSYMRRSARPAARPGCGARRAGSRPRRGGSRRPPPAPGSFWSLICLSGFWQTRAFPGTVRIFPGKLGHPTRGQRARRAAQQRGGDTHTFIT